MAISIEDIKKLRAMTGAGLADVKKALTESEGDFDKAKELLRESPRAHPIPGLLRVHYIIRHTRAGSSSPAWWESFARHNSPRN